MDISKTRNAKCRYYFTAFYLVSLICCFLFSCFLQPVHAEEQITITTYYPAPYGIYREIRTNFIAVGSGYRATAATTTDGGTQDGDAWFSGQVGIGTTNPLAPLALNTGTGTYGGLWIGQASGQAGWIYYGNTSTDWKVGKINTATNNFEIRTHDDVSRLTVTTGGLLGIGTTSPVGPLHLRASASSHFIVSNSCPGFCFSGPGSGTDEIRLYASNGSSTATNLNIVGNDVKLYGSSVQLYGNANTCIRMNYNGCGVSGGNTICPASYTMAFPPSSSAPCSGYIVCCKYCSGASTCP